MEKRKDILIFILINVIAISLTVIISLIPTLNFYKAYHYDIPYVGGKSFVDHAITMNAEFETQEAKEAFTYYTTFLDKNRSDIFYESYTWIYIGYGMLIGALLITIGIILKYKTSKTIYSKAFITAGVIIIIAFILILSILLQKNVYYSYF